MLATPTCCEAGVALACDIDVLVRITCADCWPCRSVRCALDWWWNWFPMCAGLCAAKTGRL